MELAFEIPGVKPVIDGGQPQPIHPKIKKVWQISALLTWGILAIISIPIEYVIWNNVVERPFPPIIGPIVCLSFAILSWIMADRQYRAWSYALNQHELILTHGVFWKSRRCVARGKVQHLDINSGPLDRRFGLVQVSIYTAGAAGTVGSIPGLTPERADELRKAILEGRDKNA